MGRADDEYIAAKTVEGESKAQIARELGLSPLTVSKRLQRKHVAELVENLRNGLVTTTLPSAVVNVKKVIEEYADSHATDELGKMPEALHQRREHGFKASIEVMKGAGLLPSNGGNVYVQQNVYEAQIPEGVRRVLNEIRAKEVGGRNLLDESIEGEVTEDAEEER